MGLSELLTNEQKIASLEHVKKSLSIEIYKICASTGINPDTFEYSTYVCPDQSLTNGYNGYEDYRWRELERHCKNLATAMTKLQALKDA